MNSMAVLVLSSALPVLARTLGMSNFDLLGDFGRLDWLGNFYLVWGYNLLFLAATALALINTFTARIRQELWARFPPLSSLPHSTRSLSHYARLRQWSRRLRGSIRRRHGSSELSGEPPPSLSPSSKDKLT